MGVKKKPSKKPASARPSAEATPERSERDDAPKPARDEPTVSPKERGGTELGTKISASISLIAAIVLATLVNIYSARHFLRWDLTKSGEFTLSDGTIDTLVALDGTVNVIVLVSRESPMGVSLSELLETYRTHTGKLEVEFVDPDRDQGRLLELSKRYGILAGEADGHMMTDAAILVVFGDRHRFVHAEDLIAVDDAADMRARPRLEYALTSAIRLVRSTDRKTICFTTGHGEPPLDAGGAEGMAELRERLMKNNYEVTTVFEPTADAAKNPLGDCDVLVVAAPQAPIPSDQVALMKAFIEGGGHALIASWPIPNPQRTGWVDTGVAPLLALAGVKSRADLVFEQDPGRRPPRGNGEAFFAKPGQHPVTERLLREEEAGTTPVVAITSSLEDLQTDVKPEPLLVSSPKSFGVVDYWARQVPDAQLTPTPEDNKGPLTIAVAAERQGAGGKKGARVVVLGGSSTLLGINWSAGDLRGNAILIEGAFSWLAAHERFLDIPDKPLSGAGMRFTEEALSKIAWYIMGAMPSAVAALGIAMYLMRRRRLPAAPRSEESSST